ncbi:MAG: ABC transporter permease [Bacteroidetes bacterium]|nr:ABC transporter permease [Bacteroidota bacterium]MBS1539205.1 ABC transporter permease [Bacteroidota bacterium]
MLKNYFNIAIRNILKRKFFAGINILGMTIGITTCLLISLYIIHEFSYDQFHAHADRIYQMDLHGKVGGQDIHTTTTCPPMAAALVTDIPEVESSLRIDELSRPTFRNGNLIFLEDKVFHVDSNFFSFFSFKLLSGNPSTALKDPNSIVLTEKLAKKYFGNENPLEKILSIGNDKKAFKVTGVAADCPGNSHFIFNALISASSSPYLKKSQEWLSNSLYTYFTLRPHANITDVEKKFEGLVVKYVGPEVQRFMGTSLEDFRKAGGAYGYYTTKITDIHLHSTSQGDLEPGGSMMYIYFFGGIGLFIIIIACINFMNMSTAQSAGRAKEVGLRKTLGSLRSQMVLQFLSESMLYSLLAIILSIGLCYLLLPSFNTLAGKELVFRDLLNPLFIGGIFALLLLVGVLAGSYPAFYLTSFSAVEVLKGKIRAGFKSKGIRSGLVVFQFAISIFLIIFTTVVYNQIHFMQQQRMGMDKKNVLILNNMGLLGTNKEAFKNALAAQSGIGKMSFTNNYFPGVNNTTVVRSARSEQDHIAGVYYADFDQQSVLKFEMKDGRYFSKEFPSDSTAVVINEAAAKEFGFDKAAGEEVLYNNGDSVFHHYRVIGIVKDFNFETYRDKVRPLAVFLTRTSGNLLVRYEGNAQTVVENATKLWKQYANSEPIEYTFLDENFDKLFRSEQRMGQIFSIFSGLAIFIACLGLFALAAFTAEQRTKEIGIRKVMGASVASLSLVLAKEFILLVIIAFIPAATLGWWVSSQWLNGFAYRTEINPVLFVVAGLVAVAIAWVTVGYQSVKAARANPVDSLRYE